VLISFLRQIFPTCAEFYAPSSICHTAQWCQEAAYTVSGDVDALIADSMPSYNMILWQRGQTSWMQRRESPLSSSLKVITNGELWREAH
jgi:hypothetical protein